MGRRSQRKVLPSDPDARTPRQGTRQSALRTRAFLPLQRLQILLRARSAAKAHSKLEPSFSPTNAASRVVSAGNVASSKAERDRLQFHARIVLERHPRNLTEARDGNRQLEDIGDRPDTGGQVWKPADV